MLRTSGEGKIVGSLACKKRFTTSIHFGNAMEVTLPSDDDPSTNRGLEMPGETRVPAVASAVLGSGGRVCRVGILPTADLA